MQCWPSRHPQTGRLYQWLGIDDQPLDSPPHYPGDIPDLPPAWLKGLREPVHNNGADHNLGDEPPYNVPPRSPKENPRRGWPRGSPKHWGTCYEPP